MSYEILVADPATIGESPCWVAEERALYWMDIKAQALNRLDWDTGEDRSWSLTSDIGGYAFMADGGVLVALRHGLHRLDRDSGDLTLLADPPFDPTVFRFNEGLCDAAGRFWIGVMCDPLDGSKRRDKAELHSFTLEGGLRAEGEPSALHNGMAFSADGRRFYLSNSYAREIVTYDYDPARGVKSNRRVFATYADDAGGIPDGASLDREGNYWCAGHGGARLRAFRPDGTVLRDTQMPISQPTMCIFAGDDLATMVVTSASDKMSADQRAREPLAGCTLRLETGARGIARAWQVR